MEAREARDIFDENAATYDWVNTVLSLGLDSRWRHWVAKEAARKPCARVLDAFAGTGLVGIDAAAMGGNVTLVDISPRMLSIARQRAEQRGRRIDTVLADITREPLPFKDGSFDAVTVVFGIRYLENPARALKLLSSLLKPGGRLIALEFIVPSRGSIASIAALYFFRVLPAIGASLARRRALYDYLVSSTKSLGGKDALLEIIASAGLEIRTVRIFGFGLVCGVVASRG